MPTVVRLADWPRGSQDKRPDSASAEIVIFPGIRIERHDMDLGARLTDAAGKGDFERFGGPAG